MTSISNSDDSHNQHHNGDHSHNQHHNGDDSHNQHHNGDGMTSCDDDMMSISNDDFDNF